MTKNTIRSRDVQSRSLNFHVLEAGEDRPGEDPVILLHGYPQTSHMWRHQMPVLGERFKVYAPDTRPYYDADSHIMELPDFLRAYADPDLRDELPMIDYTASMNKQEDVDAYMHNGGHSAEHVAEPRTA